MIIGNEVVCEYNLYGDGTQTNLTIGKKYKIMNTFRPVFVNNETKGDIFLIQLISDDGTKEYFPISKFISMQENREKKLYKLMNE